MKLHNDINPKLKVWIEKQRMFFVGSAPLSPNGHVNVSPKGGDSFRILGPTEAAYLDYTGSGAETIAHLRENGRIVIMFCAFEGAPQIVRLHGTGKALRRGDEGFQELAAHFPDHAGTRSIIHVQVTRVSDSCGYSVPLYDYKENRTVLDKWSEKKSSSEVVEYQQNKNRSSIDGLPAIDPV